MAEIKEQDNRIVDKTAFLKVKNDATAQLSRCVDEITEINMLLNQKEKDLPLSINATMQMSEAMEIEHLKERLSKLQEKRAALESMRESAEQRLEELKLFKKATSLSNIRYLLKTHPEVKLGQIEADGNVSTGYTSRLEKPENKTDPPVEYLAAAAKAFDIFIDTLMYAPLEDMTGSEKYLLKFVEKVARETTSENMVWKRESSKYLNETVDLDSNAFRHRLLVTDESSRDNYGDYHLARFISRFFPEKQVEVMPDPLHARMTGTDNMLYIVPMTLRSSPDDAGSFAYEVYISDDTEVVPICNTLQAHPAIASAITKLVSLIQETTAHVRLDTKARRMIDAFMNPSSQPKKIKQQVESYKELLDHGDLPF